MARSRAGLKKVVKTVRTKKGTKRQSFWVRAGQALSANRGKIAAGLGAAALLGGAAYGLHKAGSFGVGKNVYDAARGMGMGRAHSAGWATAGTTLHGAISAYEGAESLVRRGASAVSRAPSAMSRAGYGAFGAVDRGARGASRLFHRASGGRFQAQPKAATFGAGVAEPGRPRG